MYKITLSLLLALAFGSAAQAQPLKPGERAKYKKIFVKSCVKAFLGNFSAGEADDERLQQIAEDYCDCSADKVIDYYADDIGRIDEMTESQANMIAKKCVTAMEAAVKKWKASGGSGSNNRGGSIYSEDRNKLQQELNSRGNSNGNQQQERPRQQQQQEEGEDNQSDRDKIRSNGGTNNDNNNNNNNNNRNGNNNNTGSGSNKNLRKT